VPAVKGFFVTWRGTESPGELRLNVKIFLNPEFSCSLIALLHQ
jgi:hypothetical protein